MTYHQLVGYFTNKQLIPGYWGREYPRDNVEDLMRFGIVCIDTFKKINPDGYFAKRHLELCKWVRDAYSPTSPSVCPKCSSNFLQALKSRTLLGRTLEDFRSLVAMLLSGRKRMSEDTAFGRDPHIQNHRLSLFSLFLLSRFGFRLAC